MLKVKNLISKNPYIVFTLLWVFLLVFLPWRGFYMLNDDYVYEWSVRNFFENHFLLHPLVSPTLLFQSFLGSIIYKFSMSPSLLRLMTSGFYLVGVLFFYKYLCAFSKDKKLVFYLTLLLMFNPLSLYLAFTFMSDMYFLSLFIISIYYFSKYLESSRIVDVYLSSIFVSFAFFTRQTALLVLVSFLLVLFLKKVPFKDIVLFSILPVLSIGSYMFFYPKTLAYTDQSILKTIRFLNEPMFFKMVFERTIYTFYYIGLFVLPFSVSYFLTNLFPRKINKIVTKNTVIFLFLFLLFFSISLFFYFKEVTVMFYIPNIISYAGFNPQNINDGIKQSFFVDSPLLIRSFITVLSAFSIAVFLTYMLSFKATIYNNLKSFKGLAIVFSTFSIFLLSIIFRDFFDRYLIVLLPFVIFTLVFYKNTSKSFYRIFAISIILFSIIWVFFEHDYLSLNKKMWQVTYNSSQYPMINPKNTHASFEYNNYFYLDKTFYLDDSAELFNRDYMREKIDNKYLISYTDTWVYCRAERVYYPSFISKDSRTKGYFHIMVKGSEPFDPIQCKDIIKQYNYEKTQGNSNNYN